ncbi:MAG TPA: YidB family protein [Aestuariivirga sp.]|nr:YidB family protein [Aestuariivirga sp.]
MARGMPSLAALLGLVAVAGYQNRDKIGDFIRGLDDPSSPAGGMVERVKRGMGDSPMAINIKEGVGELVDRFKQGGQGAAVDSWVETGANADVSETQLEKALGSDLVDSLVQQTGLSRETLLSRLAQVLPETVDKLTPDGRLPA